MFNPLDKTNLGKSVVDALLEEPARPLSNLAAFNGAGIYAIYYHGDHEAYAPLVRINKKAATHPIYVGKAIPAGGRKGLSADASAHSSALYNRLREHADSLQCVPALDLGHFACRHLVVDDIWIPLAESLMIQRYRPLWNLVVEGFGNHDPGSGRYGGQRPLWDVMHPGRSWAEKCAPAKYSIDEISAMISSHLKGLRKLQS
ncbi:MAG: Eco29kI family restriction endonuclease [Verrucomicrobia bacterium]|nr:Eco29kI family restriction endonuclease [Verrucomicrobiota bacterium]